MPHEMVHVLFVDAFPSDPPPKWAEEGLALLMDPADKRARHAHDLEVAIRAHSTLPLGRLLVGVDYPATSQRAVFYGESMSLVDYLTHLESPKEFVRYLKLATDAGQDLALQTVYGIDRRELEHSWWQRDWNPACQRGIAIAMQPNEDVVPHAMRACSETLFTG